jgi:hypothetical protein
MAESTITLRRAAGAASLEIRVGFRSNGDVLPVEHERRRRELVERLFPSLALGGRPGRAVSVQRARPAREPVVG